MEQNIKMHPKIYYFYFYFLALSFQDIQEWLIISVVTAPTHYFQFSWELWISPLTRWNNQRWNIQKHRFTLPYCESHSQWLAPWDFAYLFVLEGGSLFKFGPSKTKRKRNSVYQYLYCIDEKILKLDLKLRYEGWV